MTLEIIRSQANLLFDSAKLKGNGRYLDSVEIDDKDAAQVVFIEHNNNIAANGREQERSSRKVAGVQITGRGNKNPVHLNIDVQSTRLVHSDSTLQNHTWSTTVTKCNDQHYCDNCTQSNSHIKGHAQLVKY